MGCHIKENRLHLFKVTIMHPQITKLSVFTNPYTYMLCSDIPQAICDALEGNVPAVIIQTFSGYSHCQHRKLLSIPPIDQIFKANLQIVPEFNNFYLPCNNWQISVKRGIITR
jgi:hypothetical protein